MLLGAGCWVYCIVMPGCSLAECRPATSSCMRQPWSEHAVCQIESRTLKCVQKQAVNGQPGQAARALWLPATCWTQQNACIRHHDVNAVQRQAASRCPSQTSIPASLRGWCVCLLGRARTGSKQMSWPASSFCCPCLSVSHPFPDAVQGPAAIRSPGQHNLGDGSSVLLI